MKKKIIIGVIVVVIVLIIGFLFLNKKNSNIQKEPQTSIITSIKDALSKKMTLVCEFKDDTGVSTKSYIKNGAVRVSSTGEIIIKDKKMYMWDQKTKQGFVYSIPDSENEEVNQSESYLKMIDKYKDSCKVSSIEDSFFTSPADVNFQDMTKLLEDMQKYGTSK